MLFQRTIKCIKCGCLLELPEGCEGRKAECVCGYKFIIPNLEKQKALSHQATREKQYNCPQAAKTVSHLVTEKRKSAFASIGTIKDELREVLYLQKAGMKDEAESKLQALLDKDELDSYYSPEKRDFELNVYFLHVYDKARVFYEREKDYRQAACYAAMAIYSRKINLKQFPYGGSVDQKYKNALDKNLKKLNLKVKAKISHAIAEAVKGTKAPINRISLLFEIQEILSEAIE